ncbi:hypothetical protein Tsubulata_041472, partial [Turnera subulata]
DMGTSRGEEKRVLRRLEQEEEDEDEEEISATTGGGGLGFGDDDKKKRGKTSAGSSTGGGGGSSMQQVSCQAQGCTTDMTEAKRYHKRHKVCEFHAKSPFVLVNGIHQRFCQQCSRFHELSEFDDTKKSCRRRLAGHNERRRKTSNEYQGEGSF